MNVIVACFAVTETLNDVKKGKLHSTMEFGHNNDRFRPITLF
jgi:hypothetical protein